MPSIAPLECDIIDASTDQKVLTLKLPLVPGVGDELDLDSGGRSPIEGVYRVVRVRYHLRPRKIVRTDDLIGVSLYIEAV